MILNQMAKQLICVVGPTAIGKTKLAIEIAKAFNTEIISSDSRQFFKELNIGTAVPSQDELNLVKQHFIQHISIQQKYSVGDFENEALSLLDHLFKTRAVVVMVGGSGLYEKAVTKGLDQFPQVGQEVKEKLNYELKAHGLESLQSELKTKDPIYYQNVDVQNPQRVIRALSVIRSSGEKFSDFLEANQIKRDFNSILIGLTAERSIIYNRINKRVDLMVNAGLFEEAKSVYQHKNLNSLNTVGYKEVFAFFDGKISREEAIELIKRNTRRFAKRQLTWYRNDDRVNWFDYQSNAIEIVKFINKKIHCA